MAGLDVAFEQIKTLAERVSRHRDANAAQHEDHEMRIRGLEESRARALGVMIAMSAVGSLIGSLIVAIIVRAISKGGPS